MHVAIVGAGAVGGAVARELVRAGHTVSLVSRTPFETLVVDDVSIPFAGGDLARASWAFVCTKAYDTPALTVAAGTRVALLQNGVEHEVRLPGCVPVVVQAPALREAPGRVRTRGPIRLTVRNDDGGRAFAAIMPGVVACVDDFTTARWAKLCVNVAGVVTVLEGAPLGCIREERVAARARILVEECARVAIAEGAQLGEDPAEYARALVAHLQAGDGDATPSILRDWRARRPLEIDARNGVIARIGARHGLATPATDALLAEIARMTRERA